MEKTQEEMLRSPKGGVAYGRELERSMQHKLCMYACTYVCVCVRAASSHIPEMTVVTGETSLGLALTEEWSLGVDCPEEARSVRPKAAVSARVL